MLAFFDVREQHVTGKLPKQRHLGQSVRRTAKGGKDMTPARVYSTNECPAATRADQSPPNEAGLSPNAGYEIKRLHLYIPLTTPSDCLLQRTAGFRCMICYGDTIGSIDPRLKALR